MSHKLVSFALSKYLQALALPTQFENGSYTPTGDEIYVAEIYLPAQTAPVGIESSSTNQFKGLYQVNVCSPRDKGKAAGLVVAEQLGTYFKRGTQIVQGGVMVLCERFDQSTAQLVGDRWVIPTRVTFSSLVKP